MLVANITIPIDWAIIVVVWTLIPISWFFLFWHQKLTNEKRKIARQWAINEEQWAREKKTFQERIDTSNRWLSTFVRGTEKEVESILYETGFQWGDDGYGKWMTSQPAFKMGKQDAKGEPG